MDRCTECIHSYVSFQGDFVMLRGDPKVIDVHLNEKVVILEYPTWVNLQKELDKKAPQPDILDLVDDFADSFLDMDQQQLMDHVKDTAFMENFINEDYKMKILNIEDYERYDWVMCIHCNNEITECTCINNTFEDYQTVR